jgi:hypothetical protein
MPPILTSSDSGRTRLRRRDAPVAASKYAHTRLADEGQYGAPARAQAATPWGPEDGAHAARAQTPGGSMALSSQSASSSSSLVLR